MFDNIREKLGFLKRVQAPQWFIDAEKEASSVFKESIKIIDADPNLKQFVDKGQISFVKKITMAKDLISKLQRVSTIQNYADKLSDLNWARFRYENIDNHFSRSNSLHYNDETQVIEIT